MNTLKIVIKALLFAAVFAFFFWNAILLNTQWRNGFLGGFPSGIVPGTSKESVISSLGEPLAKWKVVAVHEVTVTSGTWPRLGNVVKNRDERELWTYSAPKVSWFPYFMRDISFKSDNNDTVCLVESRIGRSILTAKSGVE